MIPTHTLSRRIVAAIDPDGTRWPEWRHGCSECGETARACVCDPRWPIRFEPMETAPDLAAPENLHLLLEVADAIAESNYYRFDIWSTADGFNAGRLHDWHRFRPTRSDALFAAVCAALGIEQESEDAN